MVKTLDPFLIHHLAFVLARKSEQALEERLGIGISQFRILSSIDNNPKYRQRDIAEGLNQTEAGISRQMKVMSQQGLLTVATSSRDHRQHILKLTPKGKKMLLAGQDILNSLYDDMQKGMNPKQVQEIVESAKKLHAALCPNGKSCSFPYARHA